MAAISVSRWTCACSGSLSVLLSASLQFPPGRSSRDAQNGTSDTAGAPEGVWPALPHLLIHLTAHAHSDDGSGTLTPGLRGGGGTISAYPKPTPGPLSSSWGDLVKPVSLSLFLLMRSLRPREITEHVIPSRATYKSPNFLTLCCFYDLFLKAPSMFFPGEHASDGKGMEFP